MTTEKRTQFAMAAVDFAGLFNTALGEQSFAGYRIKLTAPEGQSTGGGVQARQNITLFNDAEGKNLVVGACSTVEKNAELRTYDFVARLFQQRYGARLPVVRPEYDNLQKRLGEFFTSQQFAVRTVAAPAASTAAPATTRKSSAALITGIVILLLLAVGAGLLYYFVFQQT